MSLIVPHSSKGLYNEIILFRNFSQISFPRARTIHMPIRPCRFFSSARLYRFSSRYRFAEQSHRFNTVWLHLPANLSYASWKIFKPSLYFFLSWLFIYRFAENNHGCAAVRSRLSRQWNLLLASYIHYFLHFSDSLRTTTARRHCSVSITEAMNPSLCIFIYFPHFTDSLSRATGAPLSGLSYLRSALTRSILVPVGLGTPDISFLT